MLRTTIWLTEEQREKLAQAGVANDLCPAQLIRLAINQYLRRSAKDIASANIAPAKLDCGEFITREVRRADKKIAAVKK